MAEQILIELLVDDRQLLTALEQLEKTGQIDAKLANGFRQTTTEINKQAAAIKNDNSALAAMQKNFDQLAKELKDQLDFFKGFKEGVEQALKEAGVSLEEFLEALKNGPKDAEKPAESLRQRLKAITVQLAEMKLAGQDNTEEFKELVKEAGNIKDALGDVGQEINNLASDTSVFDGLISAVSGVTGAFAAGQGVIGLFGDESEELQKTLLKVNSAMAILQGLQQIQNVLQKESAASQLLANRQRLITNAQIAIENGLNSQSVIVRLAAAGAQRVLNAAMAANPIGIVVVALAGLITLLANYGRSAAEARRQTSNLNVALGAGADAFEDRANAIQQQGDAIIKGLENQGATGSQIAQQEIDNQKLIADARKQRLEELRTLEASSAEADLEKRQELNRAIRDLDDQILADKIEANNLERRLAKVLEEERLKSAIATTEAALLNAKEVSKEQLDIQKRLINQKAALELTAEGLLDAQRRQILEQAERERYELQVAFDKRRIDLQLKNIETQLVNVQEGSQEELNLRLQQLRLQTQSEIASTKLSEDEKRAIKEKGFQDELKLQREFNERIRREAIEAQISLNAAQLASIQIAQEDRLLLTISNIELTAAIEVDAAKGNAAKIKQINAQRDADIAATRKAFIEEQAQNELDLMIAREGVETRQLQRTAANQKNTVSTRVAALQQLAEIELRGVDIRESALEEERAKKLISDKEYNLRYAQLQDEKAKISEATELEITEIHKAENERRRELVFQTTQQVVDILGQLSSLQADIDQRRIDDEKARVAELLESGAITEKQAKERNKRLEAEEKAAKTRAAQRDKQVAIFNAVIATAQSVANALSVFPAPNFVLAGIAAALGAAQIAIIASKPIPKFRGGKKNTYEGPGIIGDEGPEIFEYNGRRYLAQKETLVWMGKQDKVYTAAETKRMLPTVDKELMKSPKQQSGTYEIDYEHLAKEVGKEVGKQVKLPGMTVDENGFKVFMQTGLSRQNYMDKYYSSK